MPIVQDNKNAALFRFLGDPPSPGTLTTLQHALTRGLEVVFQLEEGEILTEPTPSRDSRRAILAFEATEGGAGVLGRLVAEGDGVARVARAALDLMHLENIDAAAAARDPILLRDKEGAECVKGCYRCLLSYYNQPDHELIDRTDQVARRLLLRMVCSTVDPATRQQAAKSEWANALKRWSLPPADPEPLVVAEMKLPLVWRAFLVVGATGPLDDQVRQALAAKGYTIVDLPSEPGETAPNESGRLVGGITGMEQLCAWRSRAREGPRMDRACRLPSRIGYACGRCPARSPMRFCWTRFSSASQFGRRASILPELSDTATQDGARLLSDALHLSMRRGAGPFRAAGRLGFEPRAYQLVPLLMALRLPTVRLLIADDVGIGKTIEAGLVLRELVDRGEIERFAVLCPPHLVEQWTGELKSKFDLDAVAVTATSAARLERGLTISQTLFDAHPFTVVSLDYIKSDRRRESFARACPALVVVDEAHACVGAHRGRQQRFELLSSLAEDASRHMVLLTATPHSGDEQAFDRLLGLLDPSFAVGALEEENFRIRLARHLCSADAPTSSGATGARTASSRATKPLRNPTRSTPIIAPFTTLSSTTASESSSEQAANCAAGRLAFWGTLALMRCVGSSPAAAASALRNRLAADPDRLEEQVFDDDGEESDAVDVEPASGVEHADEALVKLVEEAERLVSASDPKLTALIALLKPLVVAGSQSGGFLPFHRNGDARGGRPAQVFPQAADRCGHWRASG